MCNEREKTWQHPSQSGWIELRLEPLRRFHTQMEQINRLADDLAHGDAIDTIALLRLTTSLKCGFADLVFASK